MAICISFGSSLTHGASPGRNSGQEDDGDEKNLRPKGETRMRHRELS